MKKLFFLFSFLLFIGCEENNTDENKKLKSTSNQNPKEVIIEQFKNLENNYFNYTISTDELKNTLWYDLGEFFLPYNFEIRNTTGNSYLLNQEEIENTSFSSDVFYFTKSLNIYRGKSYPAGTDEINGFDKFTFTELVINDLATCILCDGFEGLRRDPIDPDVRYDYEFSPEYPNQLREWTSVDNGRTMEITQERLNVYQTERTGNISTQDVTTQVPVRDEEDISFNIFYRNKKGNIVVMINTTYGYYRILKKINSDNFLLKLQKFQPSESPLKENENHLFSSFYLLNKNESYIEVEVDHDSLKYKDTYVSKIDFLSEYKNYIKEKIKNRRGFNKVDYYEKLNGFFKKNYPEFNNDEKIEWISKINLNKSLMKYYKSMYSDLNLPNEKLYPNKNFNIKNRNLYSKMTKELNEFGQSYEDNKVIQLTSEQKSLWSYIYINSEKSYRSIIKPFLIYDLDINKVDDPVILFFQKWNDNYLIDFEKNNSSSTLIFNLFKTNKINFSQFMNISKLKNNPSDYFIPLKIKLNPPFNYGSLKYHVEKFSPNTITSDFSKVNPKSPEKTVVIKGERIEVPKFNSNLVNTNDDKELELQKLNGSEDLLYPPQTFNDSLKFDTWDFYTSMSTKNKYNRDVTDVPFNLVEKKPFSKKFKNSSLSVLLSNQVLDKLITKIREDKEVPNLMNEIPDVKEGLKRIIVQIVVDDNGNIELSGLRGGGIFEVYLKKIIELVLFESNQKLDIQPGLNRGKPVRTTITLRLSLK